MIGMRCSTTTSKEHSQRTRAVSLKLYVSYEGLLDRYSRASCWLLVCTHYSCFVQTPNLCETGPDRDVQRRFHAGVSAGKLKGPVNPNGGGMHHGQNSAVHKIPTTGKIHTQPVLRVCPESNVQFRQLYRNFYKESTRSAFSVQGSDTSLLRQIYALLRIIVLLVVSPCSCQLGKCTIEGPKVVGPASCSWSNNHSTSCER